MAAIKPPIHELEFLKLTSNHLELGRKLNSLHFQSPLLNQNAQFVGIAWLHLGEEHLLEAVAMAKLKVVPHRALFSRSYYAAYNVSKCLRYLTAGAVSLKGDDHGKASDLPGDFPEKEKWAKVIGKLYENRLRADYDNWTTTLAEFSQKSSEALDSATDFIAVAKTYIGEKLEEAV